MLAGAVGGVSASASGLRLIGAADALRERLGSPRAPDVQAQMDQTLDSLRTLVGPAFDELLDNGRQFTGTQADAEVLAVCQSALAAERLRFTGVFLPSPARYVGQAAPMSCPYVRWAHPLRWDPGLLRRHGPHPAFGLVVRTGASAPGRPTSGAMRTTQNCDPPCA